MGRMHSGKIGGGAATAGDERGTGTAIGVAIIFPMLLLVIALLQGITFTSRTEQALQAVADRAAHTASLCCLLVGDAADAALESIAVYAGPWNRLDCQNDVTDASETIVEFRDVSQAVVSETNSAGDPNVVPVGGYVRVRMNCDLPPSHAGVFLPLVDISRSVVGVATIDPFRHRMPPGP
ncbi:hypothetical protein [Candidatus Poriferisodalis sp.]|uniref:hypothetical protein n=1 Tax=Candidatus Poriferisodalis sp. TaxID=3101277 RepID=UPI003B02EB46